MTGSVVLLHAVKAIEGLLLELYAFLRLAELLVQIRHLSLLVLNHDLKTLYLRDFLLDLGHKRLDKDIALDDSALGRLYLFINFISTFCVILTYIILDGSRCNL